jgi:hypothetical protein
MEMNNRERKGRGRKKERCTPQKLDRQSVYKVKLKSICSLGSKKLTKVFVFTRFALAERKCINQTTTKRDGR